MYLLSNYKRIYRNLQSVAFRWISFTRKLSTEFIHSPRRRSLWSTKILNPSKMLTEGFHSVKEKVCECDVRHKINNALHIFYFLQSATTKEWIFLRELTLCAVWRKREHKVMSCINYATVECCGRAKSNSSCSSTRSSPANAIILDCVCVWVARCAGGDDWNIWFANLIKRKECVCIYMRGTQKNSCISM